LSIISSFGRDVATVEYLFDLGGVSLAKTSFIVPLRIVKTVSILQLNTNAPLSMFVAKGGRTGPEQIQTIEPKNYKSPQGDEMSS
jgi:hypothetical protein